MPDNNNTTIQQPQPYQQQLSNTHSSSSLSSNTSSTHNAQQQQQQHNNDIMDSNYINESIDRPESSPRMSMNIDDSKQQQQQTTVTVVTSTSAKDSTTGDNNAIRLPWSIYKDKTAPTSILNVNVNKKPGEYVMHLIFNNFITISNRKIEQIHYGDKKVSLIGSADTIL
jgi:hypothetical protein